MYQKMLYFFIFNYEVVIDCSASPSFSFKSQVFCLFAFTHTGTCALKLSEVDKIPVMCHSLSAVQGCCNPITTWRWRVFR